MDESNTMTKKLFVPKCNYVDRYTRAGNNGKVIICPECNNEARVFHFSWSALGCLGCKEMIYKENCNLEAN